MNATPLLLAAAGLAAALAVGAAPDAPKALPIQACPVTWSSNALPVEASGVLARRDAVDLSFLTPGLVADVAVRAGDVVTRGQVLASLRLDEVDARLAQARAALEKAERDAQRSSELFERKVIGQDAFQDAATARDLAAAQVRAAEFARRFSVLTAPANGRILRRSAEPNQLVAAGQPVLGFASDDGGWIVRAALPPADAARLRVGDEAAWWAAGEKHARHAARVVHLAESSEPATRTIEAELAPSEVPVGYRSGLVVHARIQPGAVAPRARIPASALVEGREAKAAVFLLAPGGSSVRRVQVEVEALDGADAYLRTPLPAEALVVVRGAEFLRDGAAVSLEAP